VNDGRQVWNTAGSGDVAWSPDGQFVAYEDGNKITIGKARDGTPIHTLLFSPFGTVVFDWSSNSKRIATLGNQQTTSTYSLDLWEASTGRLSKTYPLPDHAPPSWMSWSPDDALIAAIPFEGTVIVYHMQ
jgi:WD40 repeat protein